MDEIGDLLGSLLQVGNRHNKPVSQSGAGDAAEIDGGESLGRLIPSKTRSSSFPLCGTIEVAPCHRARLRRSFLERFRHLLEDLIGGFGRVGSLSDGATDDQVAGALAQGFGGRGDALLVTSLRSRGPDAGDDQYTFKTSDGAQGSGLLRRADEAAQPCGMPIRASSSTCSAGERSTPMAFICAASMLVSTVTARSSGGSAMPSRAARAAASMAGPPAA